MRRIACAITLALPLLVTSCAETSAYTPVPGQGPHSDYVSSHLASWGQSMSHAGYTLHYNLLNTNSNIPPYEAWIPGTVEREATTIGMTLDHFLFGYDWENPYID